MGERRPAPSRASGVEAATAGGNRASGAGSSTDVIKVDADALSHEDALHLWMQILELRHMGAEPNNYGLPQYQRDNLEATLEDLDATDVATLLAAYGHVQGICQAQVSTAANARLRRIRENAQTAAGADERGDSEAAPEEEDEWNALMQGVTALHTVQGGLSTFALNLQSMTDQLSGDEPCPASGAFWTAPWQVDGQVWHWCWTWLYGQ